MARELDPRIADILREYGENPDDKKGVIWDCHGTWVVYHRALERVAARAGISFDKPDVLRAERDEAVIMVTARMGDRADWDIGEALINVNYRVSGKQAAYVYAMALKRARDRLILKLVGLHGLLYSEEEADQFKRGGAGDPDDEDSPARDQYLESCRIFIREAEDPQTLRSWWSSDDSKHARRDFGLSQDEVDSLKTQLADRLQQLAPRAVS